MRTSEVDQESLHGKGKASAKVRGVKVLCAFVDPQGN